jgi:hypothetical protein
MTSAAQVRDQCYFFASKFDTNFLGTTILLYCLLRCKVGIKVNEKLITDDIQFSSVQFSSSFRSNSMTSAAQVRDQCYFFASKFDMNFLGTTKVEQLW